MLYLGIGQIAFQKFTLHKVLVVQEPFAKNTVLENAVFIFSFWQWFLGIIHSFKNGITNKWFFHSAFAIHSTRPQVSSWFYKVYCIWSFHPPQWIFFLY